MPNSVPVWPAGAPGSEHARQQEVTFVGEMGLSIRNVVAPSLTPYLPSTRAANGTAVVVAPGGAFLTLAWEHEGVAIAEWLAERGVAAFLLKYRLTDTGASDADFEAFIERFRQRYIAEGGLRQVTLDELAPQVRPLAVADGEEAVRIVRRTSAQWSVEPSRVGFLGFSAGAFVATGAALSSDPAARPDFVAPIYGGASNGAVPAEAPPLFAVVAADDPLCLDSTLDVVNAWLRAGRPAELHLYERGGHGFGANRMGLPVDSWLDRLTDWMHARGLLTPMHAA